MTIRRAQAQDQKRIGELLDQVHDIHARARSDIFRVGRRKYPDAELEKRLADALAMLAEKMIDRNQFFDEERK